MKFDFKSMNLIIKLNITRELQIIIITQEPFHPKNFHQKPFTKMTDHKITLQNVTSDLIPKMIGKAGSGMKRNVVIPAWKMYEEVLKNDETINEDKPKLFVGLDEGEDNSVEATIKTSSETMVKLATYCVTKYANDFHQRSERRKGQQFHTLFAQMSHSSTGLLVGRQGKILKGLISDASESFNGSPEEQEKASKSFVKIDPHSYESIPKFNEMVRTNENMSFLGWPPEEGDDDEYISIKVSNYMSDSDFLDFFEEFKESIDEKIKSINSYHDNMMSSIRDALQ